MRFCVICSKQLNKQKLCCSKKCQLRNNNNKRKLSYSILECPWCWKVFVRRKHCKIRYCCKEHYHEHQKILMLGNKNGSFISQEAREVRSQKLKDFWKIDENKEKMRIANLAVVERLGYWPATAPDIREKIVATTIKNHGVTCIFKSDEYRKKTEDTCLRLYGKHSWDLAREANKKKRSSLEKRFEQMLLDAKINFISSYKVLSKTKKTGRIQYYEFDFYLPDKNLLIEIHGDYWHGNPKFYSKLDETQIHSQKNDKTKAKLARQKKFRLIIIWGSDFDKIDIHNL